MRKEASDDALARAAGGGDRDAFAALLARYYDRLFAFAFRLTGARAEAEDLEYYPPIPAHILSW